MKHAPKKRIPEQNTFDNVMIGVGFAEPIVEIPQVIQIYTTQNASGLSLITWTMYTLTSVVWIIWGIKRKLKPIYIPQIAWLFFEGLIIYGIIKYS